MNLSTKEENIRAISVLYCNQFGRTISFRKLSANHDFTQTKNQRSIEARQKPHSP